MGLGEHESEKSSEGVTDDGDRLELVGDDVLVELLDDGREDGAGGVRAGGISSKARDLDEVQPMGGDEELCFSCVDVARAGEAGDKDDVGAIAWRDAFDDDGEACRRGDDALAEYWFLQQQDSGEEEKKGDEAEDRAGNGGHGLAPWNYFSVRDAMRCR